MIAHIQSKKAGMPKILNLILGVIMIAVGGLGIFGEQVGIILPALPSIIFTALIAVGGIVLLLDAAAGVGDAMRGIPRKFNLIMGILVFLCGAALVVSTIGLFLLPDVPLIIMNGIILAAGVITLLDGIVGAKNTNI